MQISDLRPDMDEREVGLIYLLSVIPELWSRGVGASLMQAGMQDLRDLGMREVILWVLGDNLRARHFYEHLGWTPDGRTVSENYGGCRLEGLCYRRLTDACRVTRSIRYRGAIIRAPG
jgi:RimJ/RimL family protein N-acetyltransferase